MVQERLEWECSLCKWEGALLKAGLGGEKEMAAKRVMSGHRLL
jgi:hypothetical protein